MVDCEVTRGSLERNPLGNILEPAVRPDYEGPWKKSRPTSLRQ
jgi:hypothetical protein